MKNNIGPMFLLLVILQALHSVEEFTFGFYEKFPPMVFLYRNAPYLAKPAFVISNMLLVSIGLIAFYRWVQPVRRGAAVVVWIGIAIESLNVTAHLIWAALIGGYNPGLATGLLFVPVLIYLCYLNMHTRTLK
jgi:hypothetical protein